MCSRAAGTAHYLKRTIDELPRIVALTEDFFVTTKTDSGLRFKSDLIIEEVFVNMVKYGESEHEILLELVPLDDGIQLVFTDFDVDEFDPREAATVDADAPLDARTPGGLGIHLILKMADQIQYKYRDRTSTLTLGINRRP